MTTRRRSTPADAINFRLLRSRIASGERPDINRALATLQGRQALAADLVWVQGLTQAEAAKQMGIKQPTVCELLHLARANFLDALTLS